MLHHLGLDRGDGILPLLLGRDRIGDAQFLLGDAENFLFQRGLSSATDEFARLLGGLFGELDYGVDHRLEMPVAEHHSAEHHVFVEFLGFRLHH